ncbi:hypothetical protein HK405_010566 [Cladochytrium tenue]|nr:hypothetical protein HK405_010566 [Cladochytrium tenue]
MGRACSFAAGSKARVDDALARKYRDEAERRAARSKATATSSTATNAAESPLMPVPNGPDVSLEDRLDTSPLRSVEDLIKLFSTPALEIVPPKPTSGTGRITSPGQRRRQTAAPQRPGAPPDEERELAEAFFSPRNFLPRIVHHRSYLAAMRFADPLLRMAVCAGGAAQAARADGVPAAATARTEDGDRAAWYYSAARAMVADAVEVPTLERLQAIAIISGLSIVISITFGLPTFLATDHNKVGPLCSDGVWDSLKDSYTLESQYLATRTLGNPAANPGPHMARLADICITVIGIVQAAQDQEDYGGAQTPATLSSAIAGAHLAWWLDDLPVTLRALPATPGEFREQYLEHDAVRLAVAGQFAFHTFKGMLHARGAARYLLSATTGAPAAQDDSESFRVALASSQAVSTLLERLLDGGVAPAYEHFVLLPLANQAASVPLMLQLLLAKPGGNTASAYAAYPELGAALAPLRSYGGGDDCGVTPLLQPFLRFYRRAAASSLLGRIGHDMTVALLLGKTHPLLAATATTERQSAGVAMAHDAAAAAMRRAAAARAAAAELMAGDLRAPNCFLDEEQVLARASASVLMTTSALAPFGPFRKVIEVCQAARAAAASAGVHGAACGQALRSREAC